jgi:hypothetical protein
VSPPDRIAALKAAATAPQLIARVGDVRFAVDRITAGGNSGGCDLGRLDPGRIGLAGHSFGAATVQAVAGQRYAAAGGRSIGDPRIIGFIALSPSAPKDGGDPGFAFAQVTRPFLSVTGSRDASPLDPGLTPASRQAVFAGLPPGNAYLLVAGDADHAILSGSDEGRAMHSTGTDDAGVDRVVEQVTTLFWRATLLGDAAAARRLKALPPAMLPVGFTYTAK